MEVIILVGIVCLSIGFLVGRASAGNSGDAIRNPNLIGEPPSGMNVPLPENLEAAVKELLRRQQKIEAIKLYREKTRSGLKEAKDAVDRLERTL